MKPTLLLSFCLFVGIYSHGILVCPPARAGQNSSPGLKLYPEPPTPTLLNACDVSVAGSSVATYTAGSVIPITWDTTLIHTSTPGVRIAVSYGPNDNFNANVLVNGHDIGISGLNTMNVTLPAGKTSNSAIIQWVWASTDDGGYYLGCADIQIVSSISSPPACAATVGNTVFGGVGVGLSGGSVSVPAVGLTMITFLLYLL